MPQPGISTQTYVLQAAGATPPVVVKSATNNGVYGPGQAGVPFQPGILVALSNGASLTYSIEVTGDDVNAAGYNPANGNWSTFTGMGGLTASAVGTLGAAVTAIRAHVTNYASGTLTFQFVQVGG